MPMSIFDIFKVGIGPSSSHTMGPMVASNRFLATLQKTGTFDAVAEVIVELYGSLALTGLGHCTDKAILLGLEGEMPDTIDPQKIDVRTEEIRTDKKLILGKKKRLLFDPQGHLQFFRRKQLPLHSNGMIFKAFDADGNLLLSDVYYSIGGGHVCTDEEFQELQKAPADEDKLPYKFKTAKELLALGKKEKLFIHDMTLANECSLRAEEEVKRRLDFLWQQMDESIERGCLRDGVLPGRLQVKRRAKKLFEELKKRGDPKSDPLAVLDWVTLFALAVNEENASGSKIVTAPTNGASGIIPALIKYYDRFSTGADVSGIHRFLLTAGTIGILYAKNASVSGAEVGCQGEVGVACSMGAGGLVAALGGTNEQAEQAAEIGMEHNLGLTCDPIGGLVQIPCIERNAMGAVKAINAARIALRGDGTHYVSLDDVMKTMMQTGADMKTIYKETSRGGLAVNVAEC
ncbi:MAG: L-serine ammonia-lyase [Deltaproteobacteria bacterium]|nr:L-serine ammonia-lyase [Deltaproteobacteria bacterium]